MKKKSNFWSKITFNGQNIISKTAYYGDFLSLHIQSSYKTLKFQAITFYD